MTWNLRRRDAHRGGGASSACYLRWMAAKSRSQGADDLSFEAHLEALEKVVADLEGDALSLEASIDRYKDGVSHLSACRKILDAAEQRLSELVTAPDGTLAEKPLAVGSEGLVDAGPARRERSASSKPKPPTPPADDDIVF